MSTVRVIQNKQRLTKEGNAPLYITFYLGKEKLMLPCKVSVPAAKFDEKSGLLKGNSKEAKDINLIVSNLKARVNDILVKFRLRNQALTKDIFMREYNNPSDYKTFHDFVKEHMKTYSRRIEMGTFKHHLSCMKKFKAYNELLQFQDLTPDYLTDYLIYMKKELGNTEITAQRNMSTIKIYRSLQKGLYRRKSFPGIPYQKNKKRCGLSDRGGADAVCAIILSKNIAGKASADLGLLPFHVFHEHAHYGCTYVLYRAGKQ